MVALEYLKEGAYLMLLADNFVSSEDPVDIQKHLASYLDGSAAPFSRYHSVVDEQRSKALMAIASMDAPDDDHHLAGMISSYMRAAALAVGFAEAIHGLPPELESDRVVLSLISKPEIVAFIGHITRMRVVLAARVANLDDIADDNEDISALDGAIQWLLSVREDYVRRLGPSRTLH